MESLKAAMKWDEDTFGAPSEISVQKALID